MEAGVEVAGPAEATGRAGREGGAGLPQGVEVVCFPGFMTTLSLPSSSWEQAECHEPSPSGRDPRAGSTCGRQSKDGADP